VNSDEFGKMIPDTCKQMYHDWLKPSHSLWPRHYAQDKIAADTSNSIEESRRSWRQRQILCQSNFSRGIDSSWRIRQTDSWCGWLLKREHGVFETWKCYWFELRPRSKEGSCPSARLNYHRPTSKLASKGTKTLLIISVLRRPELDSAGGFVIAARVAGRRSSIFLAAETQEAATDLENMLSRRLCRSGLTDSPNPATKEEISAVSPRSSSETGTGTDSSPTNSRVDPADLPSLWNAQNAWWCGFLLKLGRGPMGTWQRRWFELRWLPSSSNAPNTQPVSTPLFYYSPTAGDRPRRLEVTSARREPDARCGAAGAAFAVLSVVVAGRRGRMLLAARTSGDAEQFLQQLAWRLSGGGACPQPPPPPPRAAGIGRAVARSSGVITPGPARCTET
jgi:hypothetical protein